MDLIKLKSFITVARLKSFRKASEELLFFSAGYQCPDQRT